MNTTAPVIALDHPAALDVARVGRKAANLAAARAAGLPASPGVVLTSDWASDDRASAVQVWRITSHDGARPLVVRPSTVDHERRPSAAAGAIDSPTVVDGVDAMLAALGAIRDDGGTTPILLQPHVPSEWRGVLFADEAAGGWRARPLVVARASDGIGSGESTGEWIAELDLVGRVMAVLSADTDGAPPADVLARLSRLAVKVTAAFDGPHDLEWIADTAGRLHLLRVRPVVRFHVAPTSGFARQPDEIVSAA